VLRVMSTDVVSVDPETAVGEIIAAMIEARIGAVPVVDPATQEVIGIVSYVDVLRAVQARGSGLARGSHGRAGLR
jgi:CBS domain-containing protein